MYVNDIFYLDESGKVNIHQMKDGGFLIYKDILGAPTKVERIMKEGLVFGRFDAEENITRSGMLIPPSRIIKIYWEDNYSD